VITFIVALEGITQVITYQPLKTNSREEIKLQGYKILEKLRLTQTVPAAGIMFVSRKNNRLKIDPVVWVRDIKTLFYETACASGTTAVALAKAVMSENKSKAAISILQPSGKLLKVLIKLKNGVPDYAEIGGPVRILKKNISLIL
jgi:diaminopimelate epimerase